MIRQTGDLVYASVTSGLVIASIQWFLGGLLFASLSLDAPVFWGVVMGFFALLPFFGTWVVWLPAAIWLGSAGQMIKALTLAAIGAAVVGGVDNVLRPALLAGRARMNGLLMFVSLLGGVSVFGCSGSTWPAGRGTCCGPARSLCRRPGDYRGADVSIEDSPRVLP